MTNAEQLLEMAKELLNTFTKCPWCDAYENHNGYCKAKTWLADYADLAKLEQPPSPPQPECDDLYRGMNEALFGKQPQPDAGDEAEAIAEIIRKRKKATIGYLYEDVREAARRGIARGRSLAAERIMSGLEGLAEVDGHYLIHAQDLRAKLAALKGQA